MPKSTVLKSWLTLIFLSVIWGTSFILIKKSLIVFSPVEVAILRVAISGLAFTPFFIKYWSDHEWHRWKLYMVVALSGSAIPAVLFATAQTQIGSAIAGILNSTTPIFALIIGMVFFKSTITIRQVSGIALGFIGAVGLIAIDASTDDLGGQIAYGSLIILGSVFYGANVNIVKEYFTDVTPLRLSTLSFFLVGMPFWLIIPFSDIPTKVVSHPYAIYAVMYLTFLAVISTVFCLYIFYQLVQDTNALFASSVAYLIPIVALVWGFFDGEVLGMWHFISLLIIIIGVYLIRDNPRKQI